MFPTLNISDIKNKWRDALKNSSAIDDFCQNNFGKSAKIFVGLNVKKTLGENDYPLIILRPGTKIEGLRQERNRYAISISWGIIDGNVTVSGNVVEYNGIDKIEELGQLILNELVEINPAYPISTIEYETDGIEYFPKFVGEMMLELEIQPAIGVQLSY